MAQYEWHDETGLGHPSLVYLDISDIQDDLAMPLDEVLGRAKIIKVKRIESLKSIGYTKADHRPKVRAPKGYEFVWYHSEMSRKRYACFVAFRRIERKGGIRQ